MSDCLLVGFAAGVVMQTLAFGLLWRVPDRLSRGATRALLSAGIVGVAVYAAHDADYTLLFGELLLGAAGWRMAGTSRSAAAEGRP